MNMALWTYWSGEPLPGLSPLEDFTVDSDLNIDDLVALTDLERQEVEAPWGLETAVTSPASDIINAPENVASAKGINKAGFRAVGDLAFADDGHQRQLMGRPAPTVRGCCPHSSRPGSGLPPA
jgi:hypothetical protein